MKAACLAAALACMAASHAQGENSAALSLLTQYDRRTQNDASLFNPGARARNVQAAELRFELDAPLGNTVRGAASARRESDGQGRLALNELSFDRAMATGYITAGKKVMSWDVGYAFRPLDLVQQEDRRALNRSALEGVPLLAWEAFDAERAITIVVSNPGRKKAGQPRDDGALAARLYRRSGSRDEFVVLRLSERNGIEGGVGCSHVATDALQLHGSLLLQQRHQKWISTVAPATVATADPARWQSFGGGGKVMAGLTWTNEDKLSLLAEAWIDRTAYSRSDWSAWRMRNAALLGNRRVPRALVAANIGWNGASLRATSLRRQNVVLRAAQNWGGADASVDVLWMPEDGGRATTLALSWKPGPWLLSASWRRFGGRADSVTRALPVRESALVSVQRSF